jgi:glycosyltransferase involved in cell wall biosynthesis
MSRVDMHVHSCHSKHPSEWLLQRLGAQESYTPTEKVYRLAKERGAAFVTLTDHNTIDGAMELVARHPQDCFVSTEATAYFPEDGCKIHVLCYGITPAQFDVIQKAREDIYNLRDYLCAENIACSVAHATFNINDRLKLEHLEKLILLFDVFEGINGTEARIGNQTWQEVLRSLTPEKIQKLEEKYHIKPWSDTPWRKGMTGGSDDHAGLFIGETFTVARGRTPEEFLNTVRAKRSLPGGRFGDHKTVAYAIYKIASEFAQSKTNGAGAPGLPGMLAAILFNKQGPAFREWLFIKKLGFRSSACDRILSRFLNRLMEIAREAEAHETSWQVDQSYQALAVVLDDFVVEIAQSVDKGMRGGEAPDIIQSLTAVLPALIFSAPFFSALRVLNRSRGLNQQLTSAFNLTSAQHDPRVLWFSDTVTDLNGVAVTLHEIAATAQRLDRPLRMVACIAPQERNLSKPTCLLELPCVYAVTPQFYNAHTVRLPSLLRAVDLIAAQHPDMIVISTPGPVGLTGMVAAWLLGVPCVGVYHTDFARQAESIMDDANMAALVEGYTRWFFSRMDEIRVPSKAYMTLLADRGLDRSKMRLFPRGLDERYCVLDETTRERVQKQWFAEGRPTVLYAGRLGAEKNLGLLVRVWKRLVEAGVDAQFMLAGDGPERENLQQELAGCGRVIFTGRLERDTLRACYSLADIFVFPSTTDTFGMVILEAQAFGMPAVVTNKGGPQEIVQDGRTGYVLDAANEDQWFQTVRNLIEARRLSPHSFAQWRTEISALSRSLHNWEALLNEIMGSPVRQSGKGAHALPTPPEAHDRARADEKPLLAETV